MFETILKIKEFWLEYNFEIFAFFLLFFFLIGALYKKIRGESGTYSTSYFYDKDISSSNKKQNNRFFHKDSKGEIECRRVLEKIFRRSFNKIRPNFLNNPVTDGNYNLELDCYNDDLKLAVEYSGKQHYEYVPYFHKNKEAFYNQKYRDELKKRMCKDNGIILIEVPYSVKHDDIEQYLINEIKKNYKI